MSVLGHAFRSRARLLGLALVIPMTACQLLTGEPSPVPVAPRQLIGFDRATLAPDGLSVHLEFVGGEEFDPANPCSVDYEAQVDVDGDVLHIYLYAKPHPMSLPPGTACAALGFSRTLDVDLSEQFDGQKILDMADVTRRH